MFLVGSKTQILCFRLYACSATHRPWFYYDIFKIIANLLKKSFPFACIVTPISLIWLQSKKWLCVFVKFHHLPFFNFHRENGWQVVFPTMSLSDVFNFAFSQKIAMRNYSDFVTKICNCLIFWRTKYQITYSNLPLQRASVAFYKFCKNLFQQRFSY